MTHEGASFIAQQFRDVHASVVARLLEIRATTDEGMATDAVDAALDGMRRAAAKGRIIRSEAKTLFVAAVNLLRNERVRQRRLKRLADALHVAAQAMPTTISEEELIQGLTERTKAAVALKLAGFKSHEIASTLGVTERTVEQDFHEARVHLEAVSPAVFNVERRGGARAARVELRAIPEANDRSPGLEHWRPRPEVRLSYFSADVAIRYFLAPAS